MTHAATDQVVYREFLGRIVDTDGEPVGTCFQVVPGFLVSALHVVVSAGGGQVPPTVGFVEMSRSGQTGRRIARVEREDQINDLVLLRTDQPMPRSVSHLSLSDVQAQNTPVWLGGYAIQQDSTGLNSYPFLETSGRWEGQREDTNGVVRGVAHASGTAKGMSGCPIVRTMDGAVIGILSHRYRGEEQWGDHRVWASRVEDLERLFADVGDLADQVAVDRGNAPIKVAVRAQLAAVALDKQALLNDRCFLRDPVWDRPWEEATQIIESGDVLTVSGPPGVGTTTFSQHLLAQASPEGTRLARLDPDDWEKPSAAALPQQPHSAYLLELRDPESDRPTPEFLHDLNQLAPWLRSMKIRLVITVAHDLWHGWQAEACSNIRSVYLDNPPNPVNLARHLLEQQSPKLANVVDQPNVVRYLLGRNALQTMDAVEIVRQEDKRLSIAQASESKPSSGSASAEAPGSGEPDPRLSILAERVGERLNDHSERLDDLFAEAPGPERSKPAGDGANGLTALGLPLEDRCLLIVLAGRNTARLTQMDEDARRLEGFLTGTSTAKAVQAPNAMEALSGAGLRGRVRRIDACVDPAEMVTFQRASFGPAALRYVWDNYGPVRSALAQWLISVAGEGPREQQLIVRHLSDLLRRHQDVGFIKKTLADLALKQDNTELLVEIVHAGVVDEHMQRRCERLLYEWASSTRSELQKVVVAVCARLLRGNRRSLALRRLRRVVDADRTPPEILGNVLDHWRTVADDPALGPWFRQETATWMEADATRVSARLAFTALLSSTAGGGLPWLLSAEPHELPRADEMLGEVLVSVSAAPGIGRTIAELVEKAAADDDLYTRTIKRIVEASVANGVIRQLWDLDAELQEVATRTGRDPRSDIQAGLNDYRARPAPPVATAVASAPSDIPTDSRPEADSPTPTRLPAQPEHEPSLQTAAPHQSPPLHGQTPAQDGGTAG